MGKNIVSRDDHEKKKNVRTPFLGKHQTFRIVKFLIVKV